MIRHLNSCSRYANKSGRKRIPRSSSLTPVTSRDYQSVQSPLFQLIPSSIRPDNKQFRKERLLSSLQHDLSPISVSQESDDEGHISRKDFLLESFATRTINNVSEIIKFLDTKQTKRGRRIRVSSRWHKLIGIERRRNHRRHGQEQKPMSLEELWAEALEEANIPFLEPSSELSPPPSESEEGDQRIDRNDSIESEMLSPVLGLHLDESGKLRETATLTTNGETIGAEIDVDAILSERKKSFPSKNRRNINLDATIRAVALLSASRTDEWDMFDASYTLDSRQDNEEVESELMLEEESEVAESHPTTSDGISELLADMEAGKYILTTAESNLLLAQIVTSVDGSVDAILNDALHLFEQMKTLGNSGREESGPDVNTFRILIMALSRRLMASGEALKLSKEIFDSGLEMTPEAFLNCMEICFDRNDLAAATGMLNAALENNESFRPPVESYLRMIEMMKSQNLQAQALNLLKRAQELNGLNVRDEGKLLSSLCNWPVRSRRGDLIDTAPLLHKLLYTLENRSKDDEKPEPNVWTALIHRLSKNAKSGNSQWKDVNQAIHSFLTLYPDIAPSPILLKQGLDAGDAMTDAGIITQIIHKQLHHRNDVLSFDSMETSELFVNEELAQEVASIPQGVFRRSFQICIQSGDTESASSILDSFNSTKDSYPMKVQSEIFGLALLCYTKAGRVEDAKEILFTMVENNMEPSEDLHAAVLYHLVVDDKIEEALDLFGKMEEQQSGLTTTPGTSSYNAILLAHVRSKSWDAALSLYEIMKEKKISANPQTIQSLVLATYKRGGKLSVLTLLESLLASGEATFDEKTVLLAVRVLLPDAPGDIDGIRSMLREMGDANESLKRPALDLTRSLRTAQVEQNRRASKNQPKARVKPQEDGETWQTALGYLLTFVRASSTSSS